jgi:hypothetical protein
MRYPMLLCALLALLSPQDPRRPAPPADAAPLAPVQEPFRTKVERDDLIQRFAPPSVLEGFYKLRRLERPGLPQTAAEGYLWIGRRHLMLQLSGQTGDPDLPALQSGVRRYQIAGDVLAMSVVLGFRNDIDGNIRLEPAGTTIRHRFTLLGPILRVHREGEAFLEFERVE